jgi:alkylhydroperoxidase family enzyme
MTSGPEALHRVAPEAAAALEDMESTAWGALGAVVGAELAVEVARACAGVHELVPLEPPPTLTGSRRTELSGDRAGPAGRDAAGDVLAFVTQCSTDVSAVTTDQRRVLFDRLGADAATVVAAGFVMDFLPRTRAALDALFGPAPDGAGDGTAHGGTGGAFPDRTGGPSTEATSEAALWASFDRLIRTVPRLDALDPVTSELVRLRGARQHRCRLCQSLRSRPALVAGADDTLFAAVDHYDSPTTVLSPAQQAAVAFTDAMIWTPGRLAPAAVDGVRTTLSSAQQVELVLDVTRNALNKVAVALGADAAHVDEGIEIYDIDESGDLVYGLSLD